MAESMTTSRLLLGPSVNFFIFLLHSVMEGVRKYIVLNSRVVEWVCTSFVTKCYEKDRGRGVTYFRYATP